MFFQLEVGKFVIEMGLGVEQQVEILALVVAMAVEASGLNKTGVDAGPGSYLVPDGCMTLDTKLVLGGCKGLVAGGALLFQIGVGRDTPEGYPIPRKGRQLARAEQGHSLKGGESCQAEKNNEG
jgi:hypothetical protein